jgi:hypothetical protein
MCCCGHEQAKAEKKRVDALIAKENR